MTTEDLLELAAGLTPDEIIDLVAELPQAVAEALLDELGALRTATELPAHPLAQAEALIDNFAVRPHLEYLSDRIARAVEDVENGKSRRIIVQMPPRSGKSLLATQVTPAWVLSSHPSWDMMLASYSRNLATSWGRQVRRWLTDGALGPHAKIAPDAGAVENWETTEGGHMAARSIGSDLTGFGAKVLVIDDPHKNFAEAHSLAARDRVWSWWQSDVQTRLQPVSLVIVIMTRWHEDDLVGRLLSKEYEGEPDDWEVIRFPAIAEDDDVLGRAPGDPLLSPLAEESREEALARWEQVKHSVGSYTWSALYQQRPAPAQGAIFNMDHWRYWTTDPEHLAYDDAGRDTGKVRLVSLDDLKAGRWVDSWDMAFGASESSDYVVGQRWAMKGANRYLIAQQRSRWTFPETIEAMKRWAKDDPIESPYGAQVGTRIVEAKANGQAVIDSLKDKVAGIKAVKPTTSKESRARAVTPEIESGNVYLPHPAMPGYEWVRDLVSEFRNFPHDAHDDQVDAATQALNELRSPQAGGIVVPGRARTASPLPAAYRVTAQRSTTTRRR